MQNHLLYIHFISNHASNYVISSDVTPSFILLLAIIVDLLIKELPHNIHPVVWMGKEIEILSRKLIHLGSKGGILIIFISTFTFLILTSLLSFFKYLNFYLYIIISSLWLSSMFSFRMLLGEASDVSKILEDSKIEEARIKVSNLVSRNVEGFDESLISSACIESLSENFCDSIVAPIFYFLLFGLYGAVFYRVINTLDAMIGYEKYDAFGYYAARLDDLLNYIPARLCVPFMLWASLFLKLNFKNTKEIKKYACLTKSPNSGYPMASASCLLNVSFVKPNVYRIGDYRMPTHEDIKKAVNLVATSSILFFIVSEGFLWLLGS
ncbi:MAG: cobalamin biosynthesis protein [Candidatus Hydrothermarchaeota archaeon]